MPKLIQVYIVQCIIGFGISAVFVALLLWFNVMNLWHLVTHSADGIFAVFLLWFFNGIVFASVQFAIRIMRLSDEDDRPSGGKRQRIHIDLSKPVLIESTKRPSHPVGTKR